MAGLGWVVLTLVFVDEVLAVVAAGVAGHAAAGLPGAVVAPLVAVSVWWAFASPKARWGGPVARPVAKVLVFGSASAGLWLAGHPGWAAALLVFSVVVNALAQLRFVRELVPNP
ncbi:DUF2568 domain-containing protein [Nocardioides sp. GXQ0305]|uniref:DUF2568 domain-containing protein n=1 Tax=Nocardioides sp. GXQ0305 TaxID=3423912 RepID=UPI003D7D5FD7